ncbi:CorA family divalent cation transporter, partial [Mycolicibacterium insubricum]|uniref:CorA family divalent cation transporter n=1 Tax=Mycolicibacterium insubricum TaxID=444597 RepID=UPI0024B3331B
DMRKISAWVAIAAVPTMVAGIYGMNFDVMPELHMTWGYPTVLPHRRHGLRLLYRSFRRRDWL